MIPKIIHYCWFGGNPIPEEYKQYIESWKQYCSDYEIKKWDETNFDINSSAFVKEAYEAKKWAFVSDYARLKIIYDEGGIYLDTDVELIKNLDSFLVDKCFLAEETSGYVNTGLGFGAEKGNPIIRKMLEEYDGHFLLKDGKYDVLPCPSKNTQPLLKQGYKYSGKEIWKNEYVTIYPPRYFCPMDYETGSISIISDTVSIHHFTATWQNQNDAKILAIHRFCARHFGKSTGYSIARKLDFPYRVKNKIEMQGIKETVRFAINKLSRKDKLVNNGRE